MTSLQVSLGLLLALASFSILRAYQRRLPPSPRNLPLPPGPRRFPLIGNLFDMPKDYYWLTFADWKRKYGDFIYASIFGKNIIILNSAEATLDLLEKRSALYSDRPRLPMFELMGYTDWQFSLMEYGPTWRLQRKTFHQHFNQGASMEYIGVQTAGARRCLVDLMKKQEDFMDHIQHYFASSIFNVVYGLDVKPKNDPYLVLARGVVEGGVIAGVPGAFLVDMLPILKHVPEWFPGASFQKLARYYRDLGVPMRNKPFDAVKESMTSGNYERSVVSVLIENVSRTEMVEDAYSLIKDVAAIAFVAGSDTTVSTLRTYILVMALYPDTQQRLYTEITKVIGQNRLPEFDEIKDIPYLHAVVRETLRWQPVVPLGVPHSNQSDDEYRGYRVPKGCIIMANIWAILHDEKLYPRPYSFNPERFLTADGSLRDDIQDPRDFVFGLGRRICPGRHHAYNGALILAASLVATFEIKPSDTDPLPKFRENAEGISRVLMKSGTITHPKSFKCKFVSRSEAISRQLLGGTN